MNGEHETYWTRHPLLSPLLPAFTFRPATATPLISPQTLTLQGFPRPPYMCKDRISTLASDPKPRSSRSSATNPSSAASSFPTDTSSYNQATTAAASSSTTTSHSSLSSLRSSLPELPVLYPFAQIRSATNSFLSGRLSSSSWRCSLRGKDVVVCQRPFRGDPSALPARLAAVCRSHHSSLVRLLGASLAGDQIYLVYEYAAGSSLANCLRNPRDPNFTALPSWTARMQVAADLAQGLEYIHRHAATVHNRIKSSSVIVTEPHFRAKICHFGAADLTGVIPAAASEVKEISEVSSLRVRSGSWRRRIEGTRSYMAPEVIAGGDISQRSDVFAFGVVLLELLSGEEPLRYRFDRERGVYESASVVETAMAAIGAGDEDAAEERRGRIRRWVDRRLRDSFPVEAAERLVGVALRCVDAEPGMRPDMTWVEGKMSKVLLDSQAWAERVRVPADFSVSFAPR